MLRSAAVSRIQQELGFRSDKSAEIITALQDTQVELERDVTMTPWWLNSGVVTIGTTTAATQTIATPTGFLREKEDSPIYYNNTGADATGERWVELRKESLQWLRDEYQDSTGAPEAYYLAEVLIFLFPIPDLSTYVIKGEYIKADTTLATDVENDWLLYAHELMIGIAGQKLARPFRDKEALKAFADMETRGRLRVIRENAARETSNTRLAMGGED